MMLLGHMVYFTLKDNSPAAVERLLNACRTYLSGHPGTVFFAAGTLVSDLTREVNQRDFDVALQLVFESREAHDRYQVHERHQRFIAENRDNWARVRVFDANISC
ncbi:MAG: Dabb family protein [Pirellulaceae bacterium]